MSDGSKIDYCDASIQPTGWGCYGPNGTPEKPARCPYCFAFRMARRNLRGCPECRAFVPHWHPEELEKPAAWRRPRRVFIESMGDLFGAGVTGDHIAAVLGAMSNNPQHTYLLLTKCPESMVANMGVLEQAVRRMAAEVPSPAGIPMWYKNKVADRALHDIVTSKWWLGVTVTNQQDADERLPLLAKMAGWHKWVSIEPLLGPIDIRRAVTEWVCIGAQTGPGSVPPAKAWVNDIVWRCKAAGVPLFMKRNLAGVWGPDLIQEYPEARKAR